MASRQAMLFALAGDPLFGSTAMLRRGGGAATGAGGGRRGGIRALGRGIVRAGAGLIPGGTTALTVAGAVLPRFAGRRPQVAGPTAIQVGSELARLDPLGMGGVFRGAAELGMGTGRAMVRAVAPGRRLAALPAGFRRRRRMQVTNPRALRRALRRVEGFGRFARRVITIQTGKRPRIRFKARARPRR